MFSKGGPRRWPVCLTGRFVLGFWRLVLRLEDGSELLPQGSVGVGGEDGGLGAGRHHEGLGVRSSGGGVFFLGGGGLFVDEERENGGGCEHWGFYIRTAQPKPKVWVPYLRRFVHWQDSHTSRFLRKGDGLCAGNSHTKNMRPSLPGNGQA